MAETKQTVYEDIRHSSARLTEYLVKLILYPESQNIILWKFEIYKSIHRTDKLVFSHNWLNREKIAFALESANDTIHEFIKLVEDDMQKSHGDITEDQVEDAVVMYQDWLSEELSSKGYVLRTDVFEALEMVIDYSKGVMK